MRRSRDSAALVLATAALLVALGGTALATGLVITSSSQVKDGVLTGADVRNGSLTGADVEDHSLSQKEFRGSLKGSKGDPGPPGATGPAGPAGPRGPAGEDGAYLVSLGGAARANISSTVIDAGPEGSVVATATVPSEPYTEYLSMAFVNVEGDGRVTCTFGEAGGGFSPDSFVADVGQVGLLGTMLERPERFTGTLVFDRPPIFSGSGPDIRFQLACQNQNHRELPAHVVVTGRIVTLFF